MSALSILAEECELLNDSKYRSYITQVEKALKSFDSTSEWADLISALGKLNKVLLAHVKYPVIPKRVTIGKRLAQCLHPALPGGVHMKALETYDIIFKCIGTDRLAQDLFIYSAGLFPLLSHSAMNVKPVLLMIYERHFVSLGKRIKPGLNGLLLGLLPGLEEGSEFYDQTNALLMDFCECTEPVYFYTCLWECVHSCPSVRLPAITFLLSHYNKKQTMEDQIYMMGLNIGLMVEAICSAVQDVSVLVQRSLLDFLMSAFPMHNNQLALDDKAKVVKAAINVLLRRDMSLNRRFYGWLLGTSTSLAHGEHKSRGDKSESEDSLTELSYFEKFSKELLVQALRCKLVEKEIDDPGAHGKSAVLKPFRILISLLDKPEIGPVILESVLLAIFRCLHREFEFSKGAKKAKFEKRPKGESSAYEELLKTANLLFGTFEPYFIWDYTARMFEQACSNCGLKSVRKTSTSVSRQASQSEVPDTVTVTELCELVSFLLEIVSLETFSETQTEHLPNLLCSVIDSLTRHCDTLTNTEVIDTLQLCKEILSKVQPTMITSWSHDGSHDTSADGGSHDSRVEARVEVANTPRGTSPRPDSTKPLSVEEALKLNESLKKKEQSKSDQLADNSENNTGTIDKSPTKTTDSKRKAEMKTASKEKTETKTDLVKSKDKNVSMAKDENENSTGIESQKLILGKEKRLVERSHSKHDRSINLMQKCINCFQDFFHTLVIAKFIKDESLVERFFNQILVDPETSKRDSYGRLVNCDTEGVLYLNDCDDECLKTMSSACQLLVEFASFPMYGQDSGNMAKDQQKDSGGLPVWVQDLVTCCCYVDNFTVQAAAISTMLDLVILTQSVQTERKTNVGQPQTEGVMSLQILPTLHYQDLCFLSDHTHFFKTCAEILWSYLAESKQACHQMTVKLLYIVHQVAPSTWVCENVIGNQLTHDDESIQIEAFKRFTVLWHLTRHRKTDVIPGKPLRTFTRSMFVMLDSLKDETSPLKVLATTWLTHIIQQGDISRVIEPLLQMLLHPDTARVSVQHVNIQQPRKTYVSESSDDATEASIYAISSEGGQIIYHVNSPKSMPRRPTGDDFKSYALTVLGENGTQTAPSRSRSEQELHFDKVDPSNLNLKINPFGSENSIDRLEFDGPTRVKDATISNAKRLDRETCAKEGISFTLTGESSVEASEDEQGRDSSHTSSAENIAKDILDDIIQRVAASKSEPPSEASTPNASRKVSPRKLAQRTDSLTSSNAGDQELLNLVQKQRVDSPTPSEKDVPMYQELDRDTSNIHTLHMHMLLYTQKYDYERTLYALSTLKAMLTACPRLMVTTLVTTNISTLKAPQLAKLQMLLARHRKSVFGKNFFGEMPAEVMSTYRSNMFIEVLISVCLYFIRGYYPNLKVSHLTSEELLGNKQVHILATETLTLIVSEIINIMKDSGKNFVSYISDLLQKCKVQKALLHCVLAVIYNNRKQTPGESTDSKFTEAVIAFNEEQLVPSANEAFLVKLLDLMLSMIMLEEQIGKFSAGGETPPASEWDRLKVNYQPTLNNVRYNLGNPIVQQGMFVSGMLSALKQSHMSHMHRHWVGLVTGALPYMGKHLPGIVMTVVAQLCRNIEALAVYYETDGKSGLQLERLPPDHLLTMLEGLMALCHYCLLDNVSPVSIGQQTPLTANNNALNMGSTNILTNLFHVFNPVSQHKDTSPQRDQAGMTPVLDARNNILSVMPRIMACLAALWRAVCSVEKQEDWAALSIGTPRVIRQYILEFISPISLPHGVHLMGAIAVAWNDRRRKNIPKPSKTVIPQPCEDQLLLVDLVSAIKVLPMDTLIQTVKDVLRSPPHSELSRKKGIPLEVNMLQFFYVYVQRTSPSQLRDSWPSLCALLRDTLQLNLVAPGQFLLLHILNEFVQKTPVLVDKRHQKEVQELAQRLLEAVSMVAGASLEQTTWLRKNYAVKPGLNQAEEEGEIEDSHKDMDEPQVMPQRRVADLDPTRATSADSKYSVHALTALAEITAPLLDVIYTSEEKDKVAPFLITLLYNIFPYLRSHSTNNLPSIRAASQFMSSISSYQYTRKAWRREVLELLLDPAFFQMDLESLQHWTYTIDHLMTYDKTTYKDLMARVSMAQTGSLNLFTNKEAEIDQKAGMLKRLAFTVFCSDSDQYQKSIPEIQEKLAESLRIVQAPSVMAQVFNCFRVLLLRVSPQHLTSMWPTIITELIHVFLQIEQELSTETEEFVMQVQRIAALDSSWAHLGNGLNAHNNPSWMQLYLSACKLLDLCLALPADSVPQFQLYRWAFIGGAAAGEAPEEEEEDVGNHGNQGRPDKGGQRAQHQRREARRKQHKFNPHIIRLARLLNAKLKGDVPLMKLTPGRPLLTFTYLRSLAELQPFFNTLCLANQTDNLMLAAKQLGASQAGNQLLTKPVANGHSGHMSVSQSEAREVYSRGIPKSKSAPSVPLSQLAKLETSAGSEKSTKQFIEEILMRDFLEPMPP